MKKIVISGLVNIETTVAIDEFPIEYSPIDYRFFGVETSISGVGYNVTKALNTLGSKVDVLSLIGNDIYRESILNEFDKEGIKTDFLKAVLKNTAQSVIMYDKNGKRKINLDLKDIQEKEYEVSKAENAIKNADIVVACNINFSRTVLRCAKEHGRFIATDVHVIDNVEDEYNKEFMSAANILFLSNENIMGREKEFVKELIEKYDNDIIVVGMGKEGALLYVKADGRFEQYPAVKTREIVNTIGAGDALFSAFIHFYAKDSNPYEAIRRAIVFASYKIGEKGAASGFVDESKITELLEK